MVELVVIISCSPLKKFRGPNKKLKNSEFTSSERCELPHPMDEVVLRRRDDNESFYRCLVCGAGIRTRGPYYESIKYGQFGFLNFKTLTFFLKKKQNFRKIFLKIEIFANQIWTQICSRACQKNKMFRHHFFRRVVYFCTTFYPYIFSNDELHIILKRRNLEIC